jgi:hypothetical protein
MRFAESNTSLDQFRTALADTNLPFFVARLDRGTLLQVGTLENGGRSALRRAIQTRLVKAGLTATVRVTSYSASRLRKMRSLQSLVSAGGRGEIVFDRTMALTRAEAVVDLAARVRKELDGAVEGVFFQAEWRTLFVVLSSRATPNSVERGRLLAKASSVRQAWIANRSGEFDVRVRLGFDVPAGLEVVAVDRPTVRTAFLRMLRRPLRGKFGAAVVGSLLGAAITVPAMAADLVVSPPNTPKAASGEPAVDEPNFSITALSGVARDPVLFNHLWAGLAAKATIPLGDHFGAQVDLGAATDQYYGAALHLFARDPAMGLVGVVGSAESKYGVTMNRIGAELEYYLGDNMTVGARVGYQSGTAPNGAYGDLKVKFYPDPNFAITTGVELQPSFAMGSAGFEWRPAFDGLAGMSLSADGSITSTGDYRAMFRLHFQIGGKSPTLIDRDRRSDPDLGIFNQIDVSSAVPKSGYVGPIQ